MNKKIIVGGTAAAVAVLIFFFGKNLSNRGGFSGRNSLPATGQMKTYADYDDGYYQSGTKMRFKDNGDGTVIDLNTGLMWVKSGYADSEVEPPVPYQSEGPWRKYFWGDALLYCERLQLAGYDNWRLPDYKELVSILDLSRMEPSVNQEFFPGTRADFYWSSTTFTYLPPHAWYVYFNLGYVNHINKNSYFYVRPVRDSK